jgi:hypothetical protein
MRAPSEDARSRAIEADFEYKVEDESASSRHKEELR